MKVFRSLSASIVAACMLVLLGSTPEARAANAGPTAENAYAAERAINAAWLSNNADALGRLLSGDWVVINSRGSIGDKADVLQGIRAGAFRRKTMVLSNPRIRLYGNVAIVTTHLETSGLLAGKCFHVAETQTDVLNWQDRAWKSVLLHETKIPGPETGCR